MSLLRNGDDNSINFQKASCTLDGCVKIWTSRVDSVATETGKLLSGLGDDARQLDPSSSISPSRGRRRSRSLSVLQLLGETKTRTARATKTTSGRRSARASGSVPLPPPNSPVPSSQPFPLARN